MFIKSSLLRRSPLMIIYYIFLSFIYNYSYLNWVGKTYIQWNLDNLINEIIGKPSKQINKITNEDDIAIESKTEICNEFNDFFVNVGNNLEIGHTFWYN